MQSIHMFARCYLVFVEKNLNQLIESFNQRIIIAFTTNCKLDQFNHISNFTHFVLIDVRLNNVFVNNWVDASLQLVTIHQVFNILTLKMWSICNNIFLECTNRSLLIAHILHITMHQPNNITKSISLRNREQFEEMINVIFEISRKKDPFRVVYRNNQNILNQSNIRQRQLLVTQSLVEIVNILPIKQILINNPIGVLPRMLHPTQRFHQIQQLFTLSLDQPTNQRFVQANHVVPTNQLKDVFAIERTQ